MEAVTPDKLVETLDKPPAKPEPKYLPVGAEENSRIANVLKGVAVEGYEHIDILTYDFLGCWTRVNRDKPYLKDDVVAAIIASGSNYAMMSLLLGRNRARIKDFVLSNLDMYQIFEGVEQTFLDIIENAGKMQAAMGDGAQIRFFLTTLGKDRGYVTRTEQTGRDGQPLTPDMSQYSEEELERLAEIHAAAQARHKGVDA